MRSAFGKTFTYYIVIMIVAFVLLSLGFTEIFKSYFYKDQKSDLLNQGLKILEIYTESYIDDEFDSEYFNNEMKIIDKYMDYSFFVTDRDLNIITESKDIVNTLTDSYIMPFDEYESILNGDMCWIEGNINDIYSQSRYILCYPMMHNDNVEAIAFVSIPLSNLINNIRRIYIILIFVLIMEAILGFFTIQWALSEFIIPIRKLSAAAKHISKGNFDEKIKIGNNANNEIAELCQSFNIMAENLESLEERRKEIISNISHDLRSPITSIKGFLQAMLDGTISEKRYKHYMEIIYNEADRLEKLSNSILDLNTTNELQSSLKLTKFNICVVIDETMKIMMGKLDNKNVKLSYITAKRPIYVRADIDKIRRVIVNLIDNAVKFTDEGNITVTTKTDENKVYISVEDTGIGLTEEEQTRVFERLYKADVSRGMDKTGSGLGLAIVKEFIKAHNQTIELESEKGIGSKFTFTLDLA